jgi:molybdopterin-guanine dinucleotide biosynthesis protein A
MGQEKWSLDAGGVTLLERRLAALAEVATELIVSVPYGGPSTALANCVAGAAQRLRREIRWVADSQPGLGPLEGVRTSLAACTAKAAWVVAVDAQELHPALIEWLGEAASREGVLGGVPRWSGGFEPAMACYGRQLLAPLEELFERGCRELRALANIPGVVALELEEPEAQVRLFGRRMEVPELRERLSQLLGSLNTPAAYERWRLASGWVRRDPK